MHVSPLFQRGVDTKFRHWNEIRLSNICASEAGKSIDYTLIKPTSRFSPGSVPGVHFTYGIKTIYKYHS